jgi:hypothetical protein
MGFFRQAGCFYALIYLLALVTLVHCLATTEPDGGQEAEQSTGERATDSSPESSADPRTSHPNPDRHGDGEPPSALRKDGRPLGLLRGVRWGTRPQEVQSRFELAAPRTVRPCLAGLVVMRRSARKERSAPRGGWSPRS